MGMILAVRRAFFRICRTRRGSFTAAIVFGVLAGVINGFLGSGGGIIVIFALTAMFPEQDERDRFATAVLSVLPMTAVSACLYVFRDGVEVSGSAHYYAAALFGGVFGAWVMTRISPKALRLIFAALMIFAGVRALIR